MKGACHKLGDQKVKRFCCAMAGHCFCSLFLLNHMCVCVGVCVLLLNICSFLHWEQTEMQQHTSLLDLNYVKAI